MSYAYWEEEKEIKKNLNLCSLEGNSLGGGVPIIHEGNKCYSLNKDGHTLIVGATGSGKTQSTILPAIKLSLLSDESVIVNDTKGEIYASCGSEFKKRGYNVIVLDFDNSIYGNYYNPLTLPYNLYKEGNVDKSLDCIGKIGYYLFGNNNKASLDPFWENSAINLFTGVCLHLFSNGEATIKMVFDFINGLSNDTNCKDFLKKVKDNSSIYYNVVGSLESPSETRGGIIATLNQKLKEYVVKINLTDTISKSDFDISKIAKEKNAVFIISGCNKCGDNLIPLFVDQVFDSVNIYGNNDRYLSVLLDEFDRLLPIYDFDKMINYSRGSKIRFTVVIRSYIDLVNTYGDNVSMIILCFSNIIYLYANDITTLEKVSRHCGNKIERGNVMPLISVEELKTMNRFEAILFLPRCMPFRTTLIPDYKLDWNFTCEKLDLVKRK